MATVKKYAGLPDLDLGTEVYETAVPDLTEASTLPTGSDTSSDNETSDIDRQELRPENARRLFEPVVVDARNVNFSDTINGGRRSYQIRTRRRRRRLDDQTEDDESDSSQEETLQGRLARLKREAIELQAEIERTERSDGREKNDNLLKVEKDEDGDSVYEDTHQAHEDEMSKGVEEIQQILNEIHLGPRKKTTRSLEEEFMSKLSQERDQPAQQSLTAPSNSENLSQSSITAIAAFSDRLTALESLLGVSPLSHSSTTTASILPTLQVLTTQIETLHSTLTPRSDSFHRDNTTSYSTVHLDPIADKIRQLITESKRLEQSRRAASKSFEEFLENRDRHANLFHSHHHSTSVNPNGAARIAGTGPSEQAGGQQQQPQQGQGITNGAAVTGSNDQPGSQAQFTPLFLDSHASKINALYNVLPTIQNLEPMLPMALERLRALSVIHAGAADVKGDLDEIEQKLGAQERDIAVWREVIEKVEGQLKEGREVLKGNVEVMSKLVGGLEGRIGELRKEAK